MKMFLAIAFVTLGTLLSHISVVSGMSVQKVNEEPPHTHKLRHHDKYHEKINSESDKSSSNCPKCHNRPEIRMTEEQLAELRLEYVKNQILKKLKLKDRPNVSLGGLPKPIAEGATFLSDAQSDNDITGIPDEFYAKTTKKIIFPESKQHKCTDTDFLGSSMCFSIEIPADIDYMDVESAELWMYKQPHIMDMNINFNVGEVQKWEEKYFIKPFAIQETNDTEGWVKIDVAGVITKWIENDELSHLIQITCHECEKKENVDLLSMDNDFRPFIVVNTFPNRKIKRQRRNINCHAGSTECCREQFYVNFTEMNWNDWIVHPPGYHAYFCRGSCSSAATIPLSGTYYNSVIRKIFYQKNNSRTKSLELVPCCTATQFSSLQLFYIDSNNTATQKTLPNMVVEACGCM